MRKIQWNMLRLLCNTTQAADNNKMLSEEKTKDWFEKLKITANFLTFLMKKENYQNTISAKKFVKLTVCSQSSKCLIHTSINVKNWWCQWISFWLEIRVIIKSILSHPWYPSKKLWFYYQSEKNEKKGPIWLIQKNWVFRNRQFSNFFAKISEIGPWIRRID